MQQRVDGQRASTTVSLQYGKMEWNYQKLVKDARSWKSGSKVNWTQVAKDYGVHQPLDVSKLAANGGQIVLPFWKMPRSTQPSF